MDAAKEYFFHVPNDQYGNISLVPGGTLRAGDNGLPPRLIVYNSPENVSLRSVSGTLWLVEMAEPSLARSVDERAFSFANQVVISRQVPIWLAFGEFGNLVLSVIDRVSRMTLGELHCLAQQEVSVSMREENDAIWRNWMVSRGVSPSEYQDGFLGVLAISIPGARSPIGDGLLVVSDAFQARLNQLVGERAFETNEDGDKEISDKWLTALYCVLLATTLLGCKGALGSVTSCMAVPWLNCIGNEAY